MDFSVPDIVFASYMNLDIYFYTCIRRTIVEEAAMNLPCAASLPNDTVCGHCRGMKTQTLAQGKPGCWEQTVLKRSQPWFPWVFVGTYHKFIKNGIWYNCAQIFITGSIMAPRMFPSHRPNSVMAFATSYFIKTSLFIISESIRVKYLLEQWQDGVLLMDVSSGTPTIQ